LSYKPTRIPEGNTIVYWTQIANVESSISMFLMKRLVTNKENSIIENFIKGLVLIFATRKKMT